MACLCNPETGEKCMLHFDIDTHILDQAINETQVGSAPVFRPADDPKNPHPGYEHWPSMCQNCGY